MAPCGIGKKFIAELLGTFFLVFFGTGSAVITLMISESVNPNNVGIGILGGLGDWIAIALAFGLTVMVCIYLFGRISGAHLNPAVTVKPIDKPAKLGVAFLSTATPIITSTKKKVPINSANIVCK